ncbi:MAG: hypothetical protein JNL01_06220 [Bdellovibrionales bacterium]|nr:hypothetical protein [Bdellovibrionales bacterium]
MKVSLARPFFLVAVAAAVAGVHVKYARHATQEGWTTQHYSGFVYGRPAQPQRQAAAFSAAVLAEKFEHLKTSQAKADEVKAASSAQATAVTASALPLPGESRQATAIRNLNDRFPGLSGSDALFQFMAGQMTQTAIDGKVTETLLADVSNTARNMSTLLESKTLSTDERLAVLRLTDSMSHHELGLPLAENILSEEVTRGDDLGETSEIRSFRIRVAIDNYFRFVPDMERRNQFLEQARSAQNRDQKVVDMIDSMSNVNAQASAASAAAAANAGQNPNGTQSNPIDPNANSAQNFDPNQGLDFQRSG